MHPGFENIRLNITCVITLLFVVFLIESMEWKNPHVLVWFELHRDDFSVTSIFGRPTIWLKLVPVLSSYDSRILNHVT